MKINGNLTFLGGGVAENLRVEALSVDPTTPLDQQVWANSIDARLRAKLGSGVVTFATQGDTDALQSELDTTQTAAGLNANGSLAAFEGANYISESASLRAALVALDAQAKAENDALAAEAARATDAETDLQTELDATQNGAGLNADGSLAAFTGANYVSAATSLRAATVALDGQAKTTADALAAETTRATNAEGALATDLAAEVTRATEAEAAEALARTNADASIRTDFAAADAALNATLSAAITAEETARIAAITAEADTRAAADASLLSKINALGSAFNYVGTLEGGETAELALDLETLADGGRDTGDYYKVAVAGYFKVGTGDAFHANVNDGLVWNGEAGIDVIDNTNSSVAGTASYIAVSGSSETGFTVDVDTAFKTRVSTLESGLAQEITDRTTAVTSEATARAAADTVLTDNLAAEVSRATSAEGVLTTNLAAEVGRATAAEGVLTTDLAAEVIRATGVEANLQTELDATQTAAGLETNGTLAAFTGANYIAAVTSLRSGLVVLDGQAKTNADAISAEVTRALAAESALSARLACGYFLYEGASAATSHVVTHNLGNKYAAVTIVDANDNVIIPQTIKFDSDNQLTVEFNTAITCKVIVNGLKAA